MCNDSFVVISAKHAEKPTFLKASIRALETPEIERGFEVLHMGQVFDEVFSYTFEPNLICWRLEREQIALKLQVTEEPEEHILKTLYVHRLRVINLCRYFLTNNRSSNLVVRDFCRSRVDAHKIKAKYNRYHDILTLCETYINNMNSLSQARGTKAVKKILHLLAFIAIPLGIFGAIIQMSPHHDIIENPLDVLTNGGIWFWVGFSFIMPLLLLTLGYLYDRYASRKK